MRIRKPNSRPIPEDLMSDYAILNCGFVYQANNHSEYKSSVEKTFKTIHEFLKEKELYQSGNEIEFNPKSYKVRRDILTEQGFLFLWRHLDGYLKHTDSSKTPKYTEYLNACWESDIKG